MNKSNENEQQRLRKHVLDALENRGITDALEGERENIEASDTDVELDALQSEYSLEMLNKDTRISDEIEDLEGRIQLLEERTPEHVADLRARQDTLEHLKGGWRFQNWGSVRRKLEARE